MNNGLCGREMKLQPRDTNEMLGTMKSDVTDRKISKRTW